MTAVSERLDAIEARKNAATQGPWEFNLGGDWEITANGGSLDYVASISDHGDQSDLDAEFIAHAPEDVAYLLDLARKQQAALDAVKVLTREWDAIGHGTTQFDSALRVCAYKTRYAITDALEGK